MRLHKLVLLCTIVFLVNSQVLDKGIFLVSGTVSNVKKNGILYVNLFTRTGFENESDADFSFSLKVNKNSKEVSFVLENVPAGTYALRCFLDKNGNEKIDMGLFGPKEPYGFYREKEKVSRPPKFDELSFKINGDLSSIKIRLK